MSSNSKKCSLCPRSCNIDRTVSKGYCGVSCGDNSLIAAKAMLHYGEEPVISGENGSGAVFFSGCNMGCVFCQNYPVSRGELGREITADRLSEIFLELQAQGANNINLVTATHFIPQIVKALEAARPRLSVPVIFNCGGYESVDSLKMLEGLVDVYLPDIKYYDDRLALRYSNVKGYFDTALCALKEMLRQTGRYRIIDGLIKRGVIVRHLILPGCYKDSMEIFRRLAPFGKDILISLMRQYCPMGRASDYPEINRRLTTFEYKKVLELCTDLGFEGFTQDKASATDEMTPDFDFSGL
ncbi:MAG: radical SAM protein [Firmicutes bacterium]|nr:radical SAM protein [[Eubacterium] siraeum]MCM1488355.1 radical SAM protein [Bacillota bacterium]